MKKVTNFLLLGIFVIIIFTMTACPDRADINMAIWLLNKSKKDVFVYVALGQMNNPCPDTLLAIQKYGLVLEKNKPYLDSFTIPTCDTMRIFFLDLDTINKYSWEEIRKENNILKRYDLSASDARKRTITYP